MRRPALALLSRLFGARRERSALRPLYDALVAAARDAFGHVDAVVANHARSSAQGLEELVRRNRAEKRLTFTTALLSDVHLKRNEDGAGDAAGSALDPVLASLGI